MTDAPRDLGLAGCVRHSDAASRWRTSYARRSEPWDGEPQKCAVCVTITRDEETARPATQRLWCGAPGGAEHSIGVCDACAEGQLADAREARGEPETPARVFAALLAVIEDADRLAAPTFADRAEWLARYHRAEGALATGPPREVFEALLAQAQEAERSLADCQCDHGHGEGADAGLEREQKAERAKWLARFDAASAEALVTWTERQRVVETHHYDGRGELLEVRREEFDVDERGHARLTKGSVTSRDADGQRVRVPTDWSDERSSALAHLREACEAAGDNDWPDDLHLGDAIEKHLNRYLLAADDGDEWTYARPVVAGCYWWQRIPGAPPVIVDLVCGAEGWYWCTPAMMRYSDKDGTRGRWSGPIAGPGAFDPWPAEPPK